MKHPEDELYGIPLEEFTQRRNELARNLAETGEADAAGRVRKLKKPTSAAWVVNQLARSNRDDIERLLQNATDLQAANGPKAFRELTKQRHELVETLLEESERVMNQHHIQASASALRAISQTLYAATGEEERDLLQRGVLERPLETTGFEAFSTGGFDVEEEEEDADDEGPSAVEVERAEVERELEGAEAHLKDLEERVEQARAAATALEPDVRDARQKRDQLQKRLRGLNEDDSRYRRRSRPLRA